MTKRRTSLGVDAKTVSRRIDKAIEELIEKN